MAIGRRPRKRDAVGRERQQRLARAAELPEALEDQPDRLLETQVGIEAEAMVPAPEVADGHADAELAPLCLRARGIEHPRARRQSSNSLMLPFMPRRSRSFGRQGSYTPSRSITRASTMSSDMQIWPGALLQMKRYPMLRSRPRLLRAPWAGRDGWRGNGGEAQHGGTRGGVGGARGPVCGERACGEEGDPDEFVALTGLHRKHAIRLLGTGSPRSVREVS